MISPLFQVTGKEAKHFLPALVAINEEALRANPGWPSVRGLITQGKVKYRLADEQEHWQTYRELVEAVSKQGIAYADCEDLASAVAAEDRVRRGVMTESYAYNPSPNLFHVVAAVPTGSTNKVGALPTARGTLRPGFVLQDPSAAAGMGGDPTKPASFGNDGGTVEKHRPGLVKAFRHGLLPSSGVQLAAELGAGVRKGVGEALGPTSASDLGWMAGRAMLSPLNPQEIMEEDFSMEADLDGFEDLEDDDLLFEDEDALFYDDLQAFDEEEAFAEGYGSLGSTHYGSDENDLASFSAQLGGISTEIHIAKPQLQAKLEALVRAAQAKLEAGKSRAAKLLMAKVSLVLRKAKSLRTKLDLSGRALRLLSWYQDEHSASINLGPVSTTVSLAAREGGSDRRSGRRENRGERRGDRRDNRKDRHAFAEGFGSLSRYGEDPSVFEQNVAWYESTLEEGDMLEAVSKKEGQPDNRHNRRLERSLRRKGLKVVHDVDDVQAAIEEDAFAEGFGSLSRYGEDPSVFEQAVAASLHPIPTAEEAAESYMDWARHGWVTAANRNTPETWSSGVDPETGLVWSLGVGDSLTFEPEMRKLLADAAKRAVVLIRAQGGKVSEPTVVSLPDGAGKAVRVSSSDLLRSATHPLIAMKELAKARGSQLESIARELGKGANVVLQTRHAGGAFTGIYDLYFVDEGTRNKKAAAVRSQDPTHTWVYGNREPGPKTALFYGASKDAVQRAVANCPADASDQYIDEVVAGEIRAECGDLESFGVNPDRRLSRLTHGAQAAKSGGDDVKAKALLMQAEKILAASQEAPSVELRKLLRWSRGQSPSAHAQARKPDHLRSPTLRKAPVFGWTGVVD